MPVQCAPHGALWAVLHHQVRPCRRSSGQREGGVALVDVVMVRQAHAQHGFVFRCRDVCVAWCRVGAAATAAAGTARAGHHLDRGNLTLPEACMHAATRHATN